MVFARSIGNRELTFGVSGKLIMNAVVMYDHQTGTLWSQFLAEAVSGPLAGTAMQLIPSQLTTWEAWTAQHPDTLLLDRSQGSGLRRGDPYASYYTSGRAGVLGEANDDSRLRGKELVVGLDHGRERVAYSYTDLRAEVVINDTYERQPIVLTFDPIAASAAVFDRSVDGRVLTFDPVDANTMTDRETGSTWSAQQGVASSGPLAGSELVQQPAFVSFWFAWTDFYPQTLLYEASASR